MFPWKPVEIFTSRTSSYTSMCRLQGLYIRLTAVSMASGDHQLVLTHLSTQSISPQCTSAVSMASGDHQL
eukprot:4193345-Amphidinium_carterae.1